MKQALNVICPLIHRNIRVSAQSKHVHGVNECVNILYVILSYVWCVWMWLIAQMILTSDLHKLAVYLCSNIFLLLKDLCGSSQSLSFSSRKERPEHTVGVGLQILHGCVKGCEAPGIQETKYYILEEHISASVNFYPYKTGKLVM